MERFDEFEGHIVVLRLSGRGVTVDRRGDGAAEAPSRTGNGETGPERVLLDHRRDLRDGVIAIVDRGRRRLAGGDARVAGEDPVAGGDDDSLIRIRAGRLAAGKSECGESRTQDARAHASTYLLAR